MTKPKYPLIAIIYNPKSTGPGKKMASEFKEEIKEVIPEQKIRLIGTKYAGHAEEIAYKIASQTKGSLIISASGDGGYSEVINGILKAGEKNGSAIAGILPAGNANDHYNSLHTEEIIDLVKNKQTRKIDVLKLEFMSEGKKLTRYAHSYIGLGITPKAGHELNQYDLNRLNEVWIVLKALFNLHPTEVEVEGKTQKYYSLVLSNIERMSKVVTLSKRSSVEDGQFEVTEVKLKSRPMVIIETLKALTIGLEEKHKSDKFEFVTHEKTLVQLDGEIYKIDAETKTVASIYPLALECMV